MNKKDCDVLVKIIVMKNKYLHDEQNQNCDALVQFGGLNKYLHNKPECPGVAVLNKKYYEL